VNAGGPPAGHNAPEAEARGTELRLAHLHLRAGAYALARAELEALAGSDELDRDGVLDLAEVRWRTGDLQGASAAADAWLEDAGGAARPGGVLARVIAAEAAADRGRLEDSAAHVQAAAAELGDRGALELLLAGIAPRAAWPWAADLRSPDAGRAAAAPALPPLPAAPALPPLPAQPAEPSPPEPSASAIPLAPAPALVAGTARPPGATPSAAVMAPAAADLVRAGAELLAVAPDRAAVLLALAVRADRAAADAVLGALDAIGTDVGAPVAASAAAAADGAAAPAAPHAAALAYARAEALWAAGRHEEARIAYASAQRLALAPAEAGTPRSPQ
jgi:hypothetical protein